MPRQGPLGFAIGHDTGILAYEGLHICIDFLSIPNSLGYILLRERRNVMSNSVDDDYLDWGIYKDLLGSMCGNIEV